MGYNLEEEEDIKPKALTRFKIESDDISDSEIDQVVPTIKCDEKMEEADDDDENSLLDVADDLVVLYMN